jgi:hypothetical protein
MKTINNINRDIERVSNTRRKMILDSLVAFAHRNPALTLSAVIAAALGLSGHMLGCTASPTIGAAADIGKRFLKIEAGEKTRRLMRKVQRDLQPMIDNIVAPYVGTTVQRRPLCTLFRCGGK